MKQQRGGGKEPALLRELWTECAEHDPSCSGAEEETIQNNFERKFIYNAIKQVRRMSHSDHRTIPMQRINEKWSDFDEQQQRWYKPQCRLPYAKDQADMRSKALNVVEIRSSLPPVGTSQTVRILLRTAVVFGGF